MHIYLVYNHCTTTRPLKGDLSNARTGSATSSFKFPPSSSPLICPTWKFLLRPNAAATTVVIVVVVAVVFLFASEHNIYHNTMSCTKLQPQVSPFPLGIRHSVQKSQAEATRIWDVMSQNGLQFLPVFLGILGIESAVLVSIDLTGDVVLNLLPVDVDIATVNSALNEHETNTGNDGEGPADLLGGHAGAVPY